MFLLLWALLVSLDLTNSAKYANQPDSVLFKEDPSDRFPGIPYARPEVNDPLIYSSYPNSAPNAAVLNVNSTPINKYGSRNGLDVVFQWRYLDWVHPTILWTGKNFTVGNPLSQDVDIDRNGRVFVTSPQWLEGTPVTLSIITELSSKGGPLLTPYPDWTWHKVDDCDGIVSVFRIAIDECNRLWMVDTGTASGNPICPTKILVFDLRTDQLLLKYIIPEAQTLNRTAQFVNPIVEVGDSCSNTYLYVADVLGYGMLIYSMYENRSWRLNNTKTNAFGNDPEARRLTIAGESIDLDDGILGMSLSPRGFFPRRILYFNALSSFYEKFVDADSLKRSSVYEPIIYQSLSRRIGHAGAQATSRTGAIFFQLAEYTALACWNIERPFHPDNVVVLAQDQEILQYVSSIKVIVNAFGEEELWFNTNRLQKTINKTRKLNELNFRLIRGNVRDLIKNTKCAPTGYTWEKPNLQGWRRI
ncbi:hypothetical protein QAD02_006934 [Eretmocerus hayati]|uniref:Uncharacterized protein n=1 Tax=Eretmocerus hayati TaxID=131215 RepID=A0ACC2N2M3_9HYME|nr:hypothetical protein QAD02_006934 [Eretmocerus hayati]